MSGGFKNLLVWQQAMDLVAMVYPLCKALPKDEMFALSNQLRKAVTSVPSNIAEGSGRQSRKEFIQHLHIAYGSLCEVETQILIIQRLELASFEQETMFRQIASVGRLLKALSTSLRTPPKQPKKP